ncbi:N-terminal glutamine amidase-domain-containing protein, partial [Gymnopilus junonius]
VLPPDSVYTSCYCEENIYLLSKSFFDDEEMRSLWEIYVIFVSNDNKTVALWHQKAARSTDAAVVWDYHVILILRSRKSRMKIERIGEEQHSWVYDFDTRLLAPCQWKEYLNLTFPDGLLHTYERRFRVIPVVLFLQHFASDRSHMV